MTFSTFELKAAGTLVVKHIPEDENTAKLHTNAELGPLWDTLRNVAVKTNTISTESWTCQT